MQLGSIAALNAMLVAFLVKVEEIKVDPVILFLIGREFLPTRGVGIPLAGVLATLLRLMKASASVRL